MKVAFSTPSLLAFAPSILLLVFSIPVVAQIPASNVSTDCQTPMPSHLNIVNDFIGIGHFQEDCQKDSLAAVSSFTQAIRLNPKAEEPYYHRANAYYKLGNYQAAVADYTEVIRQKTGRFGFSGPAYWNRARAYEKLGKKQKAISDLAQVISESGSSAEAYFFRGNMYRDLGNKASAIANYEAAEKLFQEYLNGVFGTGHMDSINQEMLDKVRNELSRMGVEAPAPQTTTGGILQSIAKIEIKRALTLAIFIPQHPTIQYFDAQLQDLYKQLANTQPQPYKGVVENLISNAAYEKMQSLEIERSRLLKKFIPSHSSIALIDSQIDQLSALISRNKV